LSNSYINYYPEISHLSADEQEKILEKARYEAFVNLKLSGISACYLFGSLVLFFVPVALSISFFGFFSMPTLLLFVISVAGPTFLNRYLQSKLIRKGLNSILSDSDV
jgi:hypothetical protein